MNLIISLPLGVLLILSGFLLLRKVFHFSLYTCAGILTVATILIYGVLVSIYWPGADVFAIHIAVYLMSIYAVTIIANSMSGKMRWHWAPMLIIGFFVFVVMVDTVFIFLAQSGLSSEWAERVLPKPTSTERIQSRFPGTVSHDFREKGHQFNEYQQQRAKQLEQGWRVKVGWEKPAVVGVENSLLLEVIDADGLPINNASVSVSMLFPGDTKLDQKFQMQHQHNGIYRTRLHIPSAGQWDVIVLIKRQQAQHEVRTSTIVR